MAADLTDSTALSQIADAIEVDVTDDDLQDNILTQANLVGPILKEFLRHAADGTDYWLKKRSLRILADWIISLQNVATLMEQQLEAASSVVAAQEKELEELRPTKKQIWTPF